MNTTWQTKLIVIKDTKMRNALSDFLNQTDISEYMASRLTPFFSQYSNVRLDNLEWTKLCDIVQELEFNKLRTLGPLNLKFIYFLIDNNLYTQNSIVHLKNLVNELIIMPSGSRQERLTLFNKDNDNIERFFICKSYNEKRPFTLLIDTNINNKFIVGLLDDFYKSNLYSSSTTSTNFAKNFSESYGNLSDFQDISDFNYSVFKSQYEFYKNDEKELKTLIKFYIYLYVTSEYTELFKIYDPIDMIWMQKPNFLKLYKEGFELVNLNPNEEYPAINKWVIKPNGFEATSTTFKSTSYKSLDFTKIKCDFYINLAKHFYWYTPNSLSTKTGEITFVIIFLNFIFEHKTNNIRSLSEGIDYKKITTSEVYSFRKHIELTAQTSGTFNSYMTAINKFLSMCKDKGFLDVESGAFEYLYQTAKNKGNGGTSIPDEDLTLLEQHLEKLSEEKNLLHNLYHIIFHLLVETELRIGQLLSLQISEIKEGMKKGQFFIRSITKISNGEKINQQISIYAKRHIDIAINITENLRANASEKYSDYIFLAPPELVKSTNKDIKPIETYLFSRFLKRECKKIGLKEYSAENLRDTHMTKAVEFAFKRGLSALEASTLTNHTQASTTHENYVDFKVKTFAEATFGVMIGDVDIKGNILPIDNETFTKEDTVDDNCGFCKETECKIMNEIGCPMCDGFVVTLDRIPYYELKIKQFDEAIQKEEIDHEKKHLAIQKKLYVAYLTELYKLREEISNNE